MPTNNNEDTQTQAKASIMGTFTARLGKNNSSVAGLKGHKSLTNELERSEYQQCCK